MSTFGQKLRKIREEKGIPQQKLAEKLGYTSNSYIADAERGKFLPSEEKLKKSEQNKLLFFQPEELFFYLEEEVAGEAGKEERVKGYKVRVQYQPVGDAEKKTKREAVAQVIVQALRRLRKGKK